VQVKSCSSTKKPKKKYEDSAEEKKNKLQER